MTISTNPVSTAVPARVSVTPSSGSAADFQNHLNAASGSESSAVLGLTNDQVNAIVINKMQMDKLLFRSAAPSLAGPTGMIEDAINDIKNSTGSDPTSTDASDRAFNKGGA